MADLNDFAGIGGRPDQLRNTARPGLFVKDIPEDERQAFGKEIDDCDNLPDKAFLLIERSIRDAENKKLTKDGKPITLEVCQKMGSIQLQEIISLGLEAYTDPKFGTPSG